jgi:hypothetical protein
MADTNQAPAAATPDAAPAAPPPGDVHILAFSDALAPQAASPLTRFSVRQEYLSLKTQAALNVGDLGGNTSSANRFKLIYEAMLEGQAQVVRIERAVWERVSAVGVKLEIDVEVINSSFKADIYSVAAAVELGFARATFSTTIFPADSGALRELVPESGQFNIEQYDKILAGIAKAKEALASNPDLKPQPYYRPSHFVFSAKDELDDAAAVVFAVVKLVQNEKLDDAIEEATKAGVDPIIVHDTYEWFWPAMKPDQKPPRDVRSTAGKWLGW